MTVSERKFGRLYRVVVLFALSLSACASHPTAAPVTFNDQIVRIFQQNCQTCHHPGGIAPFSLTTYEDAYQWRNQLVDATHARRMPPWKPVPGYGEFQGVRRLSDTDIDLIARWVASGAPQGDPKRLPPPKQFASRWMLGEPDYVVAPREPFVVPAKAGDLYRCFTIPTTFTEDRYVTTAEIIPGNQKIVHHVLTFLDRKGVSAALDDADPGAGYTCFGGPGFTEPGSLGGVGGWAPGAPGLQMPEQVGMLLPAGVRIVVQVHYHNTSDKSETDLTRIGLHIATTPVKQKLYVIPIWNSKFEIPAGASQHAVEASWTVPSGKNYHAIGISPHMHYLGREIKVTATYPDGTVQPLIYINDWDFNWQGNYAFAKPVPLPAGTKVDVHAVYDNSTANPRQPNSPPKVVRWGDGTTDEMLVVFLRTTLDEQQQTAKGE